MMRDLAQLTNVKRALVEQYLRGDGPPASVPAAPTPHPALEQGLSPSATGSRVALVTVQPGGSKRPLFYVHVHWEGGAFYCFSIAHHLGADQPFYVLDPYSFEGLHDPPSLETMAAAYIVALRSAQREGPYSSQRFVADA